jgi:hypothetical protein
MSAQQAHGLTEWVEISVHLRVDLDDGGIKRVDLAQM